MIQNSTKVTRNNYRPATLLKFTCVLFCEVQWQYYILLYDSYKILYSA